MENALRRRSRSGAGSAFRSLQSPKRCAIFRGVRRRFDVLISNERATIVDDYAHHPTAVRATIAAARRCHRGALVVAFQPHRYTRTAFLAREFADALAERRSGLSRAGLRRFRAGDSRRERTLDRRGARGDAARRFVRRRRRATSRSRLLEELRRRRDGADARRRRHHRRRGASGRTRRGAARARIGAGVSVTTARAMRSLLEASDRRDACARSSASASASTSRSRPTRRGRSAARPMRCRRYRTRPNWPRCMRFCLRRRMPWWMIGSREQRARRRRRHSRHRASARRRVCAGARARRERQRHRRSRRLGRHGARHGEGRLGGRGRDRIARRHSRHGRRIVANERRHRSRDRRVRSRTSGCSRRAIRNRMRSACGISTAARRWSATWWSRAYCWSSSAATARDVRAEMQTRLVRRKQTQPIALPNAGSCFRNPPGRQGGAP